VKQSHTEVLMLWNRRSPICDACAAGATSGLCIRFATYRRAI